MAFNQLNLARDGKGNKNFCKYISSNGKSKTKYVPSAEWAK